MSLIEMLQTLLAKPSEDVTDADVDALDAAFATTPTAQALIALRLRYADRRPPSEAHARLYAVNVRLVGRPGLRRFAEAVVVVRAAYAPLPFPDLVAGSRSTTPLDDATRERFIFDLSGAPSELVAKVATTLTAPVRQSLQASPSWPDLVATYPALAGA